ncbi:MAG: AAA family ATPase, partial [Gammaproteobacteria bacterium]|nr:AAA family ATPase [Gammaproteobacteria bacterium]
PFASNILSSKEVYLDSTITQLVDSLKHHIQFSPLLLIVEGEYGSGKTTLFRYLSQSEITNIKLLPIQAEASDTLIQIQHKMSFHLQDLGAANYLDDNLKQLKTFDTMPVLIIDDAHTLSDIIFQELLRYKSQLHQDKEIDLKILLLANPGMAETIEKISDLGHNQLYVQSMPVFNEKQILNFCQHRLLVSGYSGQPVLDNNNAQQILKKSKGLPLLILESASRIIEKNLKKKSRPDFSIKKLALPAIALIIIFIGLGIYLFKPAPSTKMPIADYAVPEPPQAQHEQPQTLLQQPEPTETVESASQKPEPALAPTDTEELTISVTDSITADSPEQPDEPAIPDSPAQPAAPAETRTTQTLIASSTPTKEIIKHKTVSEPAKTIISDNVQKKPVAKIPPSTTKKPDIISSPSIHPALTELTKMGIHDHQWLLQQNSSHWTLQILGAREPQTLLKFAKQHKLADDSAWYETQLSGKPWYIIVHRFYTDKEIARSSIGRLSTELKQAKPWVKNLGTIQKSIKAK